MLAAAPPAASPLVPTCGDPAGSTAPATGSPAPSVSTAGATPAACNATGSARRASRPCDLCEDPGGRVAGRAVNPSRYDGTPVGRPGTRLCHACRYPGDRDDDLPDPVARVEEARRRDEFVKGRRRRHPGPRTWGWSPGRAGAAPRVAPGGPHRRGPPAREGPQGLDVRTRAHADRGAGPPAPPRGLGAVPRPPAEVIRRKVVLSFPPARLGGIFDARDARRFDVRRLSRHPGRPPTPTWITGLPAGSSRPWPTSCWRARRDRCPAAARSDLILDHSSTGRRFHEPSYAHSGDARHLPLADKSVHVVVTSPPI